MKEESRSKNICIILPPNICPIITGTTSRLTNHSSITGVTDCAHQTGGLLIGSCYDLANGASFLNCESQSKVTHSTLRASQHNKNLRKIEITLFPSADLHCLHLLLPLHPPVFALPQCRYLASLTWPDAPRILCFAAWTTGSGDHRWVTGGHDLIVWEQLPSSGKQRFVKYLSAFLS